MRENIAKRKIKRESLVQSALQLHERKSELKLMRLVSAGNPLLVRLGSRGHTFYSHQRIPDDMHSPMLRAFVNAAMHCSTLADVTEVFKGAIAEAEWAIRDYNRQVGGRSPLSRA